MFEINEKEKRLLPSWIWENISDLGIGSVYDAFSGIPKLSFFLKKNGIQVITSDILQCNYWWNKAIVENKSTYISQDTLEKVLNIESTIASVFGEWTDSYFTKDECHSLEKWSTNINLLNINDEERALLYVSVYLTMSYWITYNRRYFQSKNINHNELFSYYVNNVNRMVFDNGMPNYCYCYDSYDIANQINTDAVYMYFPSKEGFRNYNMKFYLWECWTRRVSQINLEGVINKVEYPKLGETFMDIDLYMKAIERFLSQVVNNRFWIVSYNDQILPNKESLIEIIQNYKSIHKNIEIEVPYPTATGTSITKEGIIVAV
jgi:adenine-specific DNA methylase